MGHGQRFQLLACEMEHGSLQLHCFLLEIHRPCLSHDDCGDDPGYLFKSLCDHRLRLRPFRSDPAGPQTSELPVRFHDAVFRRYRGKLLYLEPDFPYSEYAVGPDFPRTDDERLQCHSGEKLFQIQRSRFPD